MGGAHQDDDRDVSTITWSGIRFRIAYGTRTSQDQDPVAGAYQNGQIGHLASLLDVATSVLRPGDRVLDLGAHLGGFALAAASLGCEVIAVEASPHNVALLRRSAQLNRFANLHIVHAAVSDRPGSVEFYSHGPWGCVVGAEAGFPSVSVPAIRVDDLMVAHGWADVRFIKIDVEGSEPAAVRGMPRLLGRADAPVVFFESNQHALGNVAGLTDADLKVEFRNLGYTLYRPEGGSLVPSPLGEIQEEIVVDYVAAKTVPIVARVAA